jgi:hypothetical protein
MKVETKNEVKKNVATGTSTAAGATVGVVIGTALSPTEANATEVTSSETIGQPSIQTTAEPHASILPQDTVVEPTGVEQSVGQDPTEQEKVDIEVVGYDRVTNEDGSQMDLAVLNVNGNEVGVVDVNLDGEADAIICDANHNGLVEEDEIQIVHGQGIAMQPMAEEAGFNPEYAQNDLPDYVNDADVDTYMA